MSKQPFKEVGKFTTFPNQVIDEVMPLCKPNTWKIVCATIRKTVGWQKEIDRISISQYMELTGIIGRSTCMTAIHDAVQLGFLVRFERKTGRGKEYDYALNREYTIYGGTSEETATSTETGLVTSPKIVPVTSPEIEPGTSPKIGLTKESIKKNKEINKKEKEREATPPVPDFSNPRLLPENLKLPEIARYKQVTGRTPVMPQMPIIWQTIRDHALTTEDLLPFWQAWVERGYNPANLAWLTEWAVSGAIPDHRQKSKSPPLSPNPSAFDPAGYTEGEFAQFLEY